MMVLSIPVLAISPLGLAWIWTRTRRISPTKEEIIERLHKGELDRIKKFMPRDLTKDVLETDSQFWEYMGGFRGLLRKRENAVCCVQLCQWYVRNSDIDKQDVEFVSKRAFTIAFLTLASIPEQAIRLIWRGMPHFFGRWIAQLYFDLATYTQGLHMDQGGELLAL